jgi:hypothetical protein
MKRKLFVMVVLVMAVVISQCSKETDEDAIMNLIEEDTIWFNPNSEVDSTSGDDRDTLVIWWRGAQTHDDPTIEIQITGDSAWVSYSRGNFGHFYSLAKIDTMPWVLWDKNLSETAQVRAVFMRTGEESDENRGWELDKISLAFGQSNTVSTVAIDSLRVTTMTEAVDVLITDPLNTGYSDPLH